jgi:hypothetical protein
MIGAENSERSRLMLLKHCRLCAIRLALLLIAVSLGILVEVCHGQGEFLSHAADSDKKESPDNRQPQSPNCLPPSGTTSDDAYRFNAQSFKVTIEQVTDSTMGNYDVVRLNLRFENLTDHTLLLAFHARTSILADDFGNTYYGAKAGDGPDTSVTGMGTDSDGKTESRFPLEPKQADSATFQVWGHRAANQRHPLFHYDVTIDEIDGNDQKRVLRQRAIYFGDFAVRSLNPAHVSRISKTEEQRPEPDPPQ